MAKIVSRKGLIIAAVVGVIFLPPFAKYWELRCKNQRLEERIREMRLDNKRLEAEVKRLQKDIVYIESTARDKIGVVKKGEIIIKEPQKK